MKVWRNLAPWLGMTLSAATAVAQSQSTQPVPTTIAPMSGTATSSPETVPPVAPVEAGSLDAAQAFPAELANRQRLEKPSAAGTMELTWLGHASWIMRSPSGTTVLIDPWLNNPRAPKDLVLPATIDAILVTHGHFDHLGEAAELSQKLHVPLIASFEIVEAMGLSNGIGTNPGGTIKVKDLTIHAVQAVHSSGFMHQPDAEPVVMAPQDAAALAAAEMAKAAEPEQPSGHNHGKKGKKDHGKKGKHSHDAGHSEGDGHCACHMHHHQVLPKPLMTYGGQAMGFVIDIENGPTVYHAGDTDVFASMALIREQFHPTIGILPIGGQYTMGPQGAALAAEILGLEEVLPMHYGTMSSLSGTPKDLERALEKKARVVAPAPGARVTYR